MGEIIKSQYQKGTVHFKYVPQNKQRKLKQTENNQVKEESFLKLYNYNKKIHPVSFLKISAQINLLNIFKNVFALF